MNKIGFSTGCLYHSGVKLEEAIALYYSVGANAIELGFSRHSELSEFNLSQKITKKLDKYDFISVHAPKVENIESCLQITKKLEQLSQELDVKGVVFHPNTISNYDLLNQINIPILIENMDKRQSVGITPEYFKNLKKNYNFNFVLDLQHIYEYDKTMNLADEFVEEMGNNLHHLHVSGSKKESLHSPLYLADNIESIKQALQNPKLFSTPKILEGVIRNPKNIQKEIDLLKELTS